MPTRSRLRSAAPRPIPSRCPTPSPALEARPEADNLVGIYAALADLTREAALARFAGRNFSEFKEALAELAVEVLGKIGGEMRRLMADPGYIDGVLRRGAERARRSPTRSCARRRTSPDCCIPKTQG